MWTWTPSTPRSRSGMTRALSRNTQSTRVKLCGNPFVQDGDLATTRFAQKKAGRLADAQPVDPGVSISPRITSSSARSGACARSPWTRRSSSRIFQGGLAPLENLVSLTFQVDQTWGQGQNLVSLAFQVDQTWGQVIQTAAFREVIRVNGINHTARLHSDSRCDASSARKT
jgi:hypothetical protein